MQVFDGHTDILADVVAYRQLGQVQVFRRKHLPKLKQGCVQHGNFALWMDPAFAGPAQLKAAMNHVQDELAEAADICMQVRKYSDFQEAAVEKRIAVVMGVEGLKGIGEDLDLLDWLYYQGIRWASLTWNEANSLATGIYGDTARGLTAKGKDAVRKMNQLGILVDVSHLNEASFRDVMQVTTKPVMASRSNAWALCRHPRNLKDSQIKAIVEAKGIIGVNAWPDFLHATTPSAVHYVDQIEYLISLAGIDHVAMGFDFCDFLPMPDRDRNKAQKYTALLEDARHIQNVIEIMRERRIPEEMIQQAARHNFLHFYQSAWEKPEPA